MDIFSFTVASDTCNYTALAFSAAKRVIISLSMSLILKDNGDYDDIMQDARAAAWEASQASLSANEAYNLAQRRVYAGMKSCGYFREAVASHRAGRWERRTVELSEVDL